jgi:hypothetical protein
MLSSSAHETGHFLNLPDLYDTDYSGNGLGYFCLMANSWGYDGSQYYPPHMSAWAKSKLSWTIPQIPSIGLNYVSRSEQPPSRRYPDQIYKIDGSQYGFSSTEYLLIEYRQADWLVGGIAIYHIDETVGFDDEGYPGQTDDDGTAWPFNGKHYQVRLRWKQKRTTAPLVYVLVPHRRICCGS